MTGPNAAIWLSLLDIIVCVAATDPVRPALPSVVEFARPIKWKKKKIRETDNSKVREICKLQSLIKLLKKIREIENYLRCRRRCLL